MNENIDKNDIANMEQNILAAHELLDMATDVDMSKHLSEYPNLSRLIESTPGSSAFIAEMVEGDVPQINAMKKSQGVSRLEFTLETMRKQKRRKQLVAIVKVVAAAVIAVSLAVWYNNREIAQDEQVVAESTIDKSTIILSSGKQIILDDLTANQDVEGLSISIKEGNIIEYKVSEDVDVSKAPSYNTLIVPAKHTAQLLLSDGSEVKLNAGSTLRYPVTFAGDKREVELTGEAYFKVTKNEVPFVVQADNMAVKVYGTEFNVSVRPHMIEALLVTGSIGAKVNDEAEIKLEPNQMLSYLKEANTQSVTVVDPSEHIGWMNNKFLYVNKDIKSVLGDIASWHNISFDMPEGEFADVNINFYAPRDTEIKEIIRILEFVTNATFINEGGGQYSIEN